MTPLLILILAIISTFASFYFLALTLHRAAINSFNLERNEKDFKNSESLNDTVNSPIGGAVIEPLTQNPTKLIIGSVKTHKFEFNKTPLKAFNNAYDRTIYALEEQHWEDWVDAIDKIYKMLRKDFRGTMKKFMTFLLSLSKPIPILNDNHKFETFMNQKQQLDVDKMVDRLKDQDQQDQVYIDQPETKQLPQTLIGQTNKIKTVISTQKISIIKPTILSEEMDLNTVEIDSDVELTEFQKLEQRILLKLKEIGVGNYDLWLDLADLYVKNTQAEKAKQIYTYIAKHGDIRSKQKAANGLIGLDL